MPGIALRDATPADVQAMYELDLLCFEEAFRFDPRSMRQLALDPEAISIIGEISGALGGFIVVNLSRQHSAHWAYISTLDVHPDCRRLGLGGSLIAEAESRSARAGATLMRLHVFTGNLPAIRFYEAAGYEQMLRVAAFYGRNLDAWVYMKQLG